MTYRYNLSIVKKIRVLREFFYDIKPGANNQYSFETTFIKSYGLVLVKYRLQVQIQRGLKMSRY